MSTGNVRTGSTVETMVAMKPQVIEITIPAAEHSMSGQHRSLATNV